MYDDHGQVWVCVSHVRLVWENAIKGPLQSQIHPHYYYYSSLVSLAPRCAETVTQHHYRERILFKLLL
jgi:hypothetical protein